MSSWYKDKKQEAENTITRWMAYYKDVEKVEFLVKHSLHFSRSPGKQAAYKAWLNVREEGKNNV